jgi:hypothetical protein
LGEHQLDKLGVTGSSPVPPTHRKPQDRVQAAFRDSQTSMPRSGRLLAARCLHMPWRSSSQWPVAGRHRAGLLVSLARAMVSWLLLERARARRSRARRTSDCVSLPAECDGSATRNWVPASSCGCRSPEAMRARSPFHSPLFGPRAPVRINVSRGSRRRLIGRRALPLLRGGGREPDLDLSPVAWAVQDAGAATVGVCDRLDDRET